MGSRSPVENGSGFALAPSAGRARLLRAQGERAFDNGPLVVSLSNHERSR